MAQAARELLPILLVFYLLDGLTLVGPGQFLLVNRFGFGFRHLDPGRWGSGRRGSGLRLVGLVPWEIVFASHHPLLGLTTVGVHWLDRTDAVGAARLSPESWRFVAWEDLRAVSADDRKLRLAGCGVGTAGAIPLPTSSIAHHWCWRISALLEAPEELRAAIIVEGDAAAGDLQALSAQHLRLRPALDRLATGSSLLAAGLFLALPTALLVAPPRLVTPLLAGILSGCLTLQGLGALLAVRLARTLRREGASIPLSLLVGISLYPPAMLHAASVLSRHAHAGFDGLALVAMFLEPDELRRNARIELRSVQQALQADEELEASRTEGWTELWRRRRQQVLRILEHCAVDEAAALEPPPKQDPAAVAYCGLCETGSLEATRTCPDCGISLSPFEGPAPPPRPPRQP